jgi:hypothetical protein
VTSCEKGLTLIFTEAKSYAARENKRFTKPRELQTSFRAAWVRDDLQAMPAGLVGDELD